jgi:hypothetical protein
MWLYSVMKSANWPRERLRIVEIGSGQPAGGREKQDHPGGDRSFVEGGFGGYDGVHAQLLRERLFPIYTKKLVQ